jgi:hypothetical protein
MYRRPSMPTCKDCLCYNVCQYHIDEETDMTVNECSHEFMHKDQYIKLPVYVGQTVWKVYQSYYSKQVSVTQCTVSMLQQKADKSWKFRISCTGSVEDYTLNDLGTRVFTDKKAADEKAERLERYTVE